MRGAYSSPTFLGAKRRLQRMVTLFAASIAIPLLFVAVHVSHELADESTLQLKNSANTLKREIDSRIEELLQFEERRPFADYTFLAIADRSLPWSTVTTSPLAQIPLRSAFPGVVGYFQINPDRTFSSPILPDLALSDIRTGSKLVKPEEAELRLSLWRDLRASVTRDPYFEPLVANDTESDSPHNRTHLPTPDSRAPQEHEPFRIRMTSNDEFILFRNVWLNNDRYVHGFVVRSAEFWNAVRAAVTPQSSELSYTIRMPQSFETQLTRRSPHSSSITLLNQPLAAPFEDTVLNITIDAIPLSRATLITFWMMIMVAVILIAGSWAMYMLLLEHLRMAQDRTNFVSAVTHELKTPLTSIRMYAEMLRDGVSSKEQIHRSYEIILSESERLSRLISNVLELAHIQSGQSALALTEIPLPILIERAIEPSRERVKASGFELQITIPPSFTEALIRANQDSFTQIVTNLIDNTLKFASAAERKLIDISVTDRASKDYLLNIRIRDFGPGIPTDLQPQIFSLFARGEDELTRSKPGTGIGLALSQLLCAKMQMHLCAKNVEPGVEFSIGVAAAPKK